VSALDVHIRLSRDAIAQEVSGETVILDLASESYFGLDEVGTRVWQLLRDHTSLRLVFDVMREEFTVEDSVLEGDLAALVESLVDAGLVTREIDN
jgi:hypothetical protein